MGERITVEDIASHEGILRRMATENMRDGVAYRGGGIVSVPTLTRSVGAAAIPGMQEQIQVPQLGSPELPPADLVTRQHAAQAQPEANPTA